tara:strand:+ start:1196 stop:1645 length:450 start_codon:yes stop_codon:yes gene_type:complete
MKKVKISEANLYNCEGFMHDIKLCDKLNNELAFLLRGRDNDFITLKDLTEIEPHELTCGLHPEKIPQADEVFLKYEINKIVKYLNWFDLTLKNMVLAHDTVNGETVQKSNLDYELESNGEVDTEQEALDQEAEINYEITKDFEPEIVEK